jgi:hypothetical protein
LKPLRALAGHMKFRPKSVISLPLDKKVKYLVTLPTVSDTIAARALVNYHLDHQRAMMGAFLDLLGIAHENGLINEENVTKPDAEKLKKAAAELAVSFQKKTSRSTSARSFRRIPTPGALSRTSLRSPSARSASCSRCRSLPHC